MNNFLYAQRQVIMLMRLFAWLKQRSLCRVFIMQGKGKETFKAGFAVVDTSTRRSVSFSFHHVLSLFPSNDSSY